MRACDRNDCKLTGNLIPNLRYIKYLKFVYMVNSYYKHGWYKSSRAFESWTKTGIGKI